jgi:tetratricopeptide (TPR) repeat protein
MRVLESVLAEYPDERELHERIRSYLEICRRHEAARESAPKTDEERLYAATLALNQADYDTAVAHLESVRAGDPENDHALYMLAVAYSLRGNIEQAAVFLVRAIELNPENRSLARQDADLDAVRREDGVRAALEAPAPLRPDRRRHLRRTR